MNILHIHIQWMASKEPHLRLTSILQTHTPCTHTHTCAHMHMQIIWNVLDKL